MAKSSTPAPRLGRGLSSLISVSDLPVEKSVAPPPAGSSAPPQTETPPPKSAVLDIPVGSIAPNPHQPRRSMDEATLNDLSNSIRASGVIQPIVVRRLGDGSFQLIAGERRWRASQRAGLATVPAVVREVDGFTQAQMALVENIQREDLNPIDRATGYRTLINQLGLTQQELATRLGEDRATIGHFVRLLELHPAVQEMLRTGHLSLGHAKLLAGVPDQAEQQRLAQVTISQALSMRNLERLIEGSTSKSLVNREKVATGNSMHLLDLEKSIARQIGMRVQVRSSPKSKGRGRLVIHYANLDQFDDLMTRLNVKTEE